MSKNAIVGILLSVVLCFGGCSWFGGGTSPGTGGGSGDVPHDDRIQTGDTTYPTVDVDKEKVEKEELRQRTAVTQGIRATYMPKYGENTDDLILQADRDKFDYNASLQYEIVARTILYYLVGNYGHVNGNSGENIIYEFYADTSLLPVGDNINCQINLGAVAPYQAQDIRLSGWDNAIEKQITGLSGTYNVNTSTWSVERTYTNDYKWNFNLGNVSANYNNLFIETFLPYVQVNIMEYCLGLELTPLSILKSYGPSQLQLMINEMVAKIDVLGIEANQEYADFLYAYIKDTIIGATAYNRENAYFTYNEPSYSYQVEKEPFDPENPEYDTIYVYYDMDGNPDTTTINTNQWYKYSYNDTIQTIVDFVAGTYDAEGNELTPAISKDFANYSRLELTDISPDLFFSKGNVAQDIKKLDNMEYHEYQSVVWYPDGIITNDEDMKVIIDNENKLWKFNVLSLYLDTKENITLDVYLRLHLDGENNIRHVGRYHTDTTKDYDFNATEFDEKGNLPESAYFTEQQMNSMLIYVPVFFGEDVAVSNDGVINTTQKTFYSSENAYKNTFAGKLGSSVSFGRDLIVENYFGESVDLSKYNLCADENDFVELIFVPQKTNEINDYSFKFMLKDLML